MADKDLLQAIDPYIQAENTGTAMVVFTDNSGVVWKCIAGRCLINADLYLKLANVRNQRTNK